MGRDSKLTPEIQEDIMSWIADGMPRSDAALGAGVHIATLHRWLKLGKREEEGVYRSFYDAFKKAEATYRRTLLKQIKAHGEATWQALAWILERRFPEIFSLDKREMREMKKIITEFMKNRGIPPANQDGG